SKRANTRMIFAAESDGAGQCAATIAQPSGDASRRNEPSRCTVVTHNKRTAGGQARRRNNGKSVVRKSSRKGEPVEPSPGIFSVAVEVIAPHREIAPELLSTGAERMSFSANADVL